MENEKLYDVFYRDRNNDVHKVRYCCLYESQAKRLFYSESENGDEIIHIKEVNEKDNIFKLGNIVRLVDTYWHGQFQESRDDIGKLYVISEVCGSKYGIMSKEDGNASSWWDSSQLEFVSEGSLDEIEECKKLYEDTVNKLKDLNYIKDVCINDHIMNLTNISILALFREIDFISNFEYNGEYISLYQDWFTLAPLFKAIFDDDYNQMLKSLEVFEDHCKEKYKLKAIELFNKVNTNETNI